MENWEKAQLKKAELIAAGHTSAIGGATNAKQMRRLQIEVVKLLVMPLDELRTYEPKTGIQWIAKNMIMASDSEGNKKQMAVKVFSEVKDILGERTSPLKSSTKADNSQSSIINDLPTADVRFTN